MTPAGRRVAAVALLLAALASALPTQSEGGGGDGQQQQQQGGRDQDGPPECVSGHRRPNADGCGGDCFCLGGRWVCPEADCGKGNFLLKLRSNEEPLPLRRSKRDDLNGYVVAERCAPHSRFHDDCHLCICPTTGIRGQASCTFGACPPTRRPPPARPALTGGDDSFEEAAALQAPTEPPPEEDYELVTMRPCTAADNEVSSRDCVSVPLNGERCAPGVTYMDECNTCICSQDGIKAHASCTFKPCTK